MLAWLVAPFTGAWIETFEIQPKPAGITSPPSRGRGLKLKLKSDMAEDYWVAPFTGAWIETEKSQRNRTMRVRRPLHGGVD